MTESKPRITDRLSIDDCIKVVNEAEQRLGMFSGDQLAERRELVQEARIAVMSWEAYAGKNITGEKAQQKVEDVLQKLIGPLEK